MIIFIPPPVRARRTPNIRTEEDYRREMAHLDSQIDLCDTYLAGVMAGLGAVLVTALSCVLVAFLLKHFSDQLPLTRLPSEVIFILPVYLLLVYWLIFKATCRSLKK